MRDFNKKTWTTPEVRRFEDAEEVLEHHKTTGAPEQRVRLRAMLDVMRPRKAKANLRRAS